MDAEVRIRKSSQICFNNNCSYSFDKINNNCTVTIEEMENLASFIQEENREQEKLIM